MPDELAMLYEKGKVPIEAVEELTDGKGVPDDDKQPCEPGSAVTE